MSTMTAPMTAQSSRTVAVDGANAEKAITTLECTDNVSDKSEGEVQPEEPAKFEHSWSITCIFACLCLFSFLSALDGTIITTALPTITRDIGGGTDESYVWIAQCFFFSSTVPQLLYGQLANIFGRRNPFLVAIVLFALGSGISGGASSPAMLIGGRTVQGLGSAGLFVLSDIIICDMVPPRYRGPYLSAVLSTAGIGSTVGPVIGGALAEHNWRWIFYLNVPTAALGFVVMVFFLKVKYERSPTWLHALKRVDYLGTLIFVPSMVAIFLGLITGGVQYSWSSWHVVLPLVLGFCGWAGFHVSQAIPKLCPEPSVPSRLFLNRTSAAGYLFIFLSSVTLQAIAYFLPLYFQAVKLASPLMSGVYYLPFALAIIPFAGGSGAALSKWGRYVPLHYIGFGMTAIGFGLLSILDVNSSRGEWIGFQILVAAGIAPIFTATLPSTLAALAESDVAVATATFSFMRTFGFVWGVTISGAVFNGQIDAHLDIVTNEGVRDLLRNGAAYAFAANGDGLKRLSPADMMEAMRVYVTAFRSVWLVTMAVALLGFVCVPVERQLELKKEHKTEYGLEEKKKNEKKRDSGSGEPQAAEC